MRGKGKQVKVPKIFKELDPEKLRNAVYGPLDYNPQDTLFNKDLSEKQGKGRKKKEQPSEGAVTPKEKKPRKKRAKKKDSGKTNYGDGMSVEEVMAVYFDQESMVEKPQQLYRIDNKGYRNYYKVAPDGTITVYTGLTTLLAKTLPTPKQLIDWMMEMGKEAAEAYAKERQDYGTFLHIECSKLMITKRYNLDSMGERLSQYLVELGYPVRIFHEWINELKKDVLAYGAFINDYKVKPIAVELILASENGYATAIDNVISMEIEEKGFFGHVHTSGEKMHQPKETTRKRRVRAIVDIKSGRKGFYEVHEIQLHGHKKVWEENFPDKPVEKVFNWSPKDWDKMPSYTLKDQTNSVNAEKFPHLLELGKIEERKRADTIQLYEGEIILENGLVPNFRTITFTELLKEKHEQR